MLTIDNKLEIRHLLLTHKVLNKNSTPTVEGLVLNILPIEATKEEMKGEVINVLDYLNYGEDAVIPKIKHTTPKVIKNFLNVQITNEFNRKMLNRFDGSAIDDYINDYNEIIEACKTDSDFNEAVTAFNFKERNELTNKELEDIKERYGVDNITMLVYPSLFKAIYVDQKYIPKNSGLEKGKVYRIRNDLKLYSIVEKLLEDGSDSEVYIFTNKDNIYLADYTIWEYPSIRKTNLDEIWKLSK